MQKLQALEALQRKEKNSNTVWVVCTGKTNTSWGLLWYRSERQSNPQLVFVLPVVVCVCEAMADGPFGGSATPPTADVMAV